MFSPHADVVAAIAAALGDSAKAKAVAGSVDDRGRVAWVEDRDDVAWLRVAGEGRLLVDRSLAVTDTQDYGYEGCVAQDLGWAGDHVTAITRERNTIRYFLFRLDGGDPTVRAISPACVILDDALFWHGDEPGLLHAMKLPELTVLTPLCFRGTKRDVLLHALRPGAIWVEERLGFGQGDSIERVELPTPAQRALPVPAQDFFTLVERRLYEDEVAPPTARLVVESTVLPFCRLPEETWRPSIVWLPVYWHRHLAATGHESEARELLSVLDALAAPLPEDERERGWKPEWDAIEGATILAARHARRQARLLATICRQGSLPRGWWCLLFSPAPGSDVFGSRLAGVTLPRAAQHVFDELAKAKPKNLPHTL